MYSRPVTAVYSCVSPLLNRAVDVNKLAIALLASALLLVGCGQKGPLQLPTETSQTSQS